MKVILIWTGLTGLVSGCVAPINLTYESARTLPKGQVDIQANVAEYFIPGREGGLSNVNYGAKAGFGINDNHTIKLRYERLNARDFATTFSPFIDLNPALLRVDFFELENKVRFNNKHALGLPLAYYSLGIWSFDPRYYMTFSNAANTIEFTFIPKMHFFFTLDGGFSLSPALGIGFGFSSNLDRWAIRPEVGWDGYLSAGAALCINLSPRKRVGVP